MSFTKKKKSLLLLLHGLNYKEKHLPENVFLSKCNITTVTCDSRKVKPGSLFIAVKGVESNGHDYISDAVENGCAAVLCEQKYFVAEILKNTDCVILEVVDTQSAYAAVAANFYGRPAEKLFIVGITGTNGKTTVTYLFEQVLIDAGYSVGVIGTINNRFTTRDGIKKVLPTGFTTPEAVVLQRILKEMIDAGVEYVVMEVSSHALVQARIGDISFNVAAFTNLSRDHLDYHGDMEQYFGAKLVLFSKYVQDNGCAVLPALQPESEEKSWTNQLHSLCRKRGIETISWGDTKNADIQLHTFSSTLSQTTIEMMTSSGEYTIHSPLVGRFNIDNILTVAALCEAMDIPLSRMSASLSHIAGVPGRLERISGPGEISRQPVVFVDYAHTPDALEKVLITVAALPHQNIFCLFGCGGNRDCGKRQVMGEVVGRLSDVAVITDDNPRTEDPDRIITQIIEGFEKTDMELLGESWLEKRKNDERGGAVIRNRMRAIESTIKAAGPDDIVIIAGKGHEPYQLTAQGRRFFDDRLIAKSVLYSWTANLVAEATGGILLLTGQSEKLLGSVTTDSRRTTKRGIFVALTGENHDGHEFVGQAIELGACCLVVEKERISSDYAHISQIIVSDTTKALGDLAAFRRKIMTRERQLPVIGITGSCGKTTVKEMAAAILEKKWPSGRELPEDCILKTRGNFNNLIGLPLSLLPLDVTHKAVVLEMGMNRPGELTRLAAIANPDISCIVNIYGVHLEGLHSLEGVALAKEELFAATRPSGTLAVNVDDDRVRLLAKKYPHDKITYSVLSENADSVDFWASDVRQEKENGLAFILNTTDEKIEIKLFIAGEHNVSNALAAAAIATAAGADLQQIAEGLADFRPHDKRMEIVVAKAGYRIINDTYNANPASMAAGLKTLKQVAGGTSVAIIGDMLELGESSVAAHENVGALLAEMAVDYVGIVGEFKQAVLKGAVTGGLNKDRVHAFDNKEAVVEWFKKLAELKKLGQDDFVLVKASRGLRFETIVEQLNPVTTL